MLCRRAQPFPRALGRVLVRLLPPCRKQLLPDVGNSLWKVAAAVTDPGTRPAGQVGLLLLLALAYGVAHQVAGGMYRGAHRLEVHPERPMGVKPPAPAQPGERKPRPTHQQVQMGAVSGGTPAGGQFDEGYVLKGAETLSNLGDQAGKGPGQKAGEGAGDGFLLRLYGARCLPPER